MNRGFKNRIAKSFYMVIISFIVLFNNNLAFSKELNIIENTLSDIGVPETYTRNITSYIDNLSMTEDEFNNAVDESKEIINTIGAKRSISEFKFSELIGLYKDATSLANSFDLSFSYSISSNEVKVTNKNTKDILFKGSISDLKNYYNNLSTLNNNIDINELEKMVFSEVVDKEESDLDIEDNGFNDSNTELNSIERDEYVESDEVNNKNYAITDTTNITDKYKMNSKQNSMKYSLFSTQDDSRVEYAGIAMIIIAVLLTIVIRKLIKKLA